MSRNVFLVPVGSSSGLFVASLSLAQAVQDAGSKAAVFTPFTVNECSCKHCQKYAIPIFDAALTVGKGQKAELLESIVGNFQTFQKENQADVYIIEGVVTCLLPQDEINAAIAHALDSDLVVVKPGLCSRYKAFRSISLQHFGNAGKKRVLGDIVLNKDAPKGACRLSKRIILAGTATECSPHEGKGACAAGGKEEAKGCCDEIRVVADIGYDPLNYALRAHEIANIVGGKVLSGDENAKACAISRKPGSDENTAYILEPGPDSNPGIVVLCKGEEKSVSGAKAVISSPLCPVVTIQALTEAPAFLGNGDSEKAANAKKSSSKYCGEFIKKLTTQDASRVPLMAPATFRHKLTELARKAGKRIALPEGDEPRTVSAAAKVAESRIATPVLFGKKDAILEVAKQQGVTLGEGVEFVDPEAVRANYVDRLVELRKSKGLTPEQAAEMLQDNVVLATMMIERGEVDGLVSGAVHTTANTIRPPLQIIKTAPGASLVSSVFFMLMPEQVYVFGDCAINPNPNAQELAEIAIQSADTAKTFGIDPRVAMLSYSTINSGKGPDVDVVVEAVKAVKEKRPDISVDGPLQYDAAVMENVAAQKAPGSPVAGKATVFIFPSLEAGNIAYKAVQRSAGLVSIGPMLQGMKKPVNDLSRGALVDDIIYTIAITAIQATQS